MCGGLGDVVEPEVITKVVEIDETALEGPAMLTLPWPPPMPGAAQVGPIPGVTALREKEKAAGELEAESVERQQQESQGGSPQSVDFDDNMMDYKTEKSEKDDDEQDDDRKKKKRREKKRREKRKKKRKSKRQKKRKQKRKREKKRRQRKRRQQKRKQ